MKIRTPFLILSLILILGNPAYAETQKTITLKDGTVIKGEVVGFGNGQYTIKTKNLGELSVDDSNIVSINVTNSAASSLSGSNSSLLSGFGGLSALGGAGGNSEFESQIQQLQGSILSNPQFMDQIQTLLSDPEIAALLADQELMSDLLSYDPSRLEGNAKVQKLMQNPKLKQLMNQIQATMQ